ncbi:MAG TPA: ATPase domain-containing protein, partial [Thermoplasmata archaeon]|nr:ATPase domain-containing protein [Thermoplasmata archaeon]
MSRFGIDGFEQLVHEGIPKAGSVLLLVPPVEEKDQLAAQFLLEGLRNGEAAILVGSDAAIRDLVRRMGNLGFDADKAVALGRAVPVDWDRVAVSKNGNPGGMPAIETALSAAVATAAVFPALRVVVDLSRTLPESIASVPLEEIASKLLAKAKTSGALSLFLAPRARGVAPGVVESFDMVLDLRQLKPAGVGLAVVAIGGTPLPRSGMVLTL